MLRLEKLGIGLICLALSGLSGVFIVNTVANPPAQKAHLDREKGKKVDKKHPPSKAHKKGRWMDQEKRLPVKANRRAQAHARQEKKAPAGFPNRDKEVIRGYFRNSDGFPPGLAQRDELPPGLKKQLRDRGQLPPGLQKRVEPLPLSLESRLPVLPGFYQRAIIGRDVVLLDRKNDVVVDVIPGVLPEKW